MEHTSSPVELVLRHYATRYRGWIIFGLVFFLAVWGGVSVFYSVEADSEGVVLRFGKYSKTTLPGLHTKWPWPIDAVMVVPVQQIQTLEFGFGTIDPGQVTRYALQTPEHETIARMLTGDLNLAHVEWIVQYPHQGCTTLLVQDRRRPQQQGRGGEHDPERRRSSPAKTGRRPECRRSHHEGARGDRQRSQTGDSGDD